MKEIFILQNAHEPHEEDVIHGYFTKPCEALTAGIRQKNPGITLEVYVAKIGQANKELMFTIVDEGTILDKKGNDLFNRSGRPKGHKLTAEERDHIGKVWNERPTVKKLAVEYGVTENVIKGIIFSFNNPKGS